MITLKDLQHHDFSNLHIGGIYIEEKDLRDWAIGVIKEKQALLSSDKYTNELPQYRYIGGKIDILQELFNISDTEIEE